MSIATNYYSRLEEYENIQKTNLDFYQPSYSDWMLFRRQKEAIERNAPTTTKIANFVKASFYKILVFICLGNKERAMNLCMLMAFSYVILDEGRKLLVKNLMIHAIPLSIILGSCVILYYNIRPLGSLGSLANQTVYSK